MNRERQSQPRADDENANAAAGQKTPSADMQPEDAGTSESGNDGSVTSAEPAMKQTGKTDTGKSGNR
jgi:hypothetical protein